MKDFDNRTVERTGEPSAPRAYLIGQWGETDEFCIELTAAPFTIGRADEATLRLNDQKVSRLHCAICCKGGAHHIKDLGSRNGTWLNEAPVRELPLCAGDRIRIGNVWLAYGHTPKGRPLRAGETIGEAQDFSVTIPMPRISSRSAPRSLPVLIVDDSEADRRLTAMHLEKAWSFVSDLAVEYAEDGRVALEMLRAKRFALVLLDWRLPLMDGGEVLRALRQGGLRTPVVIVSGLSREDIQEDHTALGAVFLNKEDMTAATLREAIAQSLRLLGFTRPPTG